MYKRQSAGMAVMLIPCGAGDIMQSALWKITEWILLFYEKGSGLLLELPGARWIPVSYTHLDVYKRQVNVCSLIRMNERFKFKL